MNPLAPPEFYDAIERMGFLFTRWGRDAKWPRGHAISRAIMKMRLIDFTLWYFFQGKGGIIDHHTGRHYPLRAGVCLCMLPGMDLEVWQDDEDPLGDAFIHFDVFRNGKKLSPAAWPIQPFYTEVTNAAFTDQLTRNVLAVLNHSRRAGTAADRRTTLEAELLMKGLFMHLHHVHTQAPEDPVARRHEEAVAKMLDELYENPQRFHDVDELALLSGYSASHLRALCTRITGESPGQHLIRARIETAKRYLRTTDHSIGGIAEALGYESIFYFSRQFRKNVGMTALAYRRAARKALQSE